MPRAMQVLHGCLRLRVPPMTATTGPVPTLSELADRVAEEAVPRPGTFSGFTAAATEAERYGEAALHKAPALVTAGHLLRVAGRLVALAGGVVVGRPAAADQHTRETS